MRADVNLVHNCRRSGWRRMERAARSPCPTARSFIEMIRMDQINEAYERMLKSDVKYRFVIDMASLKSE